MKIRNLNIASFLVATILVFSSCEDFLEQQPKTSLPTSVIFTDLSILEPTVDGLYKSYLSSKQGRAGFTFSLLGMDEVKQGIVQMMDASQAGLDYYNGMLNPSSSQIAEMWSRRWPSINNAAKAIKGLEILSQKDNNTEAEKARIKLLRADACFVRAMQMFEMTMYWGEVPVVEYENLDIDPKMNRRPLSEVWKQIFEDFTYAAANLLEGKQSNDFRARRAAATMMLGKLHMYAPVESGYRDFAKAITYFESIVNDYSLESNYSNCFHQYNGYQRTSNESIFYVDFRPNNTAPNHWQWDMGSRTLATMGEMCFIGGYDVALPTEYAYNLVTDGGVWEPNDTRRAASIRLKYVTGTSITDSTYTGWVNTGVSWGADELDPHIKKWEDRRVDQYTSTSNAVEATSGRSMYWSGKTYVFLRYADLLLCLAECYNEVGRTSDGVVEVNKVRRRAFGASHYAANAWPSGISKEEFKEKILDERMRELCFEGWRRMDLIRTGKFVELIKARNPWAKQSGTIKDYHMRYPIPEMELKNNPDMDPVADQNAGY